MTFFLRKTESWSAGNASKLHKTAKVSVIIEPSDNRYNSDLLCMVLAISQEKNTHGKTQQGLYNLKGSFTVTSLTVPTVHTYCKQVATKLFKCTLDQRIFMQKAAIFEKKTHIHSIIAQCND